MKLIINIPEEMHKNIIEDNCSMREMQILLRVIKNGIPFEDAKIEIQNTILEQAYFKGCNTSLEDIKNDIKSFELNNELTVHDRDYYFFVRDIFKEIYRIIDKHIKENKQ